MSAFGLFQGRTSPVMKVASFLKGGNYEISSHRYNSAFRLNQRVLRWLKESFSAHLSSKKRAAEAKWDKSKAFSANLSHLTW